MAIKTINTRIKLRVDTAANWSAHDTADKNGIKIYKGEAALSLLEGNKYEMRIGTSDTGSYWSELSPNLTIPAENIPGLLNSIYDYQLVESDTKGTFKLQKKLPSAETWTDVTSISLSFTGTYSAENPVALKDYVDKAAADATTQYFEAVRGTVTEGEETRPQTDSEVIAAYFAQDSKKDIVVKGGSTFVIKTALDGVTPTKYEYIAFTYDTTTNASAPVWRAMDGNYNWENVYVTSDITLAGSYTQVGNITKTSTETKDLATSGLNLKDLFTKIFTKAVNPTVTQPSVSLTYKNNTTSITSDTLVEVGTTIKPTWSATLNAGSYTAFAGQVATGVTASAWDVQLKKGGTTVSGKTSTASSGDFGSITLDDGDVYTIYAKATYGAGAYAKNNLKETTTIRVEAGNKDATSSKITAYRKTFWGARTAASSDAMTSADIRALANSSTSAYAAGSKFTITLPVGAKSVAFAYPATIRDCSSVKDTNGMNAEIVSSFTKFTVNVDSASGDAISYKVYFMNYADPLTKANTYTVTL